MGRNFDLIIFDCDGTLVDSETVNNLATIQILNELGLTQYTLDYALKNWVGKTISNILLSVQMETGFEFPPDTGKKYVARASALYDKEIKPVEDAIDLVKSAGTSFKICVASNGERNNVLKSLRLCGFLPAFFQEKTVFSKIQVKQGKPAPDLFLYAAEQMNTDPSRTLVIEDSPSGVMAGKAAGMQTWGFTGTSHDAQNLEITLKNSGADRVFSRLIHITDALGI